MDNKNEYCLHIKNMVCPRCIQSVQKEALLAGLKIRSIQLGELNLSGKYTEEQFKKFKRGIERHGFELITDKREQLVEAIKTTIINVVQYDHEIPGHQNFSIYLAGVLGKDYSYLSNAFSIAENTTIEKYIILQKTERAKELLTYNEHSLKEIADKLGYSSSQHLSAQFKKITGLSPSAFKKLKENNRFSIDQIRHINKKR
ncbi:MAG TPA: AraC family transcriptional regulator [Sunxiuqinia sp.]|nr:AraC family transcriptional regulator [Sunxiuqinia sp.]